MPRPPTRFGVRAERKTGDPLVRRRQRCSECEKQRPPSWYTQDPRICDECMAGRSHPRAERPLVSQKVGIAETTPRSGLSAKEKRMRKQNRKQMRERATPARTAPHPATDESSVAPRQHFGAMTMQLIPEPENPHTPLEKECRYNGPDDDKWIACRGKHHPWTHFSINRTRTDGLQDVCKGCVQLRRRTLDRRKAGETNPELTATTPRAETVDYATFFAGRWSARPVTESPAEESTTPAESPVVEPEIAVPTPNTGVDMVVPTPEPLPIALPADWPSDTEIQRVAAFLSQLPTTLQTVRTLASKNDELEASMRALEQSRDSIDQSVQHLELRVRELERVNTELNDLLKLAEDEVKDAKALAKDSDESAKEAYQKIKTQREYQRQLVRVGTRIPRKYRLLSDDEVAQIEQDSDRT